MPSSRKSDIEITGKEQALSSSAELAGKQKSLLYFRMQKFIKKQCFLKIKPHNSVRTMNFSNNNLVHVH